MKITRRFTYSILDNTQEAAMDRDQNAVPPTLYRIQYKHFDTWVPYSVGPHATRLHATEADAEKTAQELRALDPDHEYRVLVETYNDFVKDARL